MAEMSASDVFAGRIHTRIKRMASSMQWEIASSNMNSMSHCTISLKCTAKREVVMDLGPGRVQLRQARHESVIDCTMSNARCGAPTNRNNSFNRAALQRQNGCEASVRSA